MLISLHIQAEKEEDIQRITKALSVLGDIKVESEEQKKPDKKREVKAEIKVETSPVVETPAAVVETPAPADAPAPIETPAPVETLDYESMREQIKALATQFVRENKQTIGKDILAKVGAKKVSEVPNDKLEEILQAFKEA